MYSEINKKIEQNQQGIARLHKINLMIKQLEQEKERLEFKESDLKIILGKENHDVDKIKNMSITFIFYSIIGKLDERLDKEEQEVIAAKLKYKQAVKALDDVKYQISQLLSELLQYENCQKEYERLFAEKKKEILKQCGETAKIILNLTTKMNKSKIKLKEINEAAVVGQQVLDSLKCVLDSLESAGDWGTWDILGGGLISDLAKHFNFDDAEVEFDNTQKLLSRFKVELTDIEITGDITIAADGFLKFADIFFDGIIMDWLMQSKINETMESVLGVERQVIIVVNKLHQMKDQEESNIEKLESELNALIAKV